MVTNATFVKTTKTLKSAQQAVQNKKTSYKGKEWVRTDKRTLTYVKS